jgi:CBS domain-containing protein/sporulation protein YlmC with PRC-barrel domain
MTSLTTFYLSRLIGCVIFDARDNVLGKILDVYVRIPLGMPDGKESPKPQTVGFLIKVEGKRRSVILNDLQIVKFGIRYKVQCQTMTFVTEPAFVDAVLLKESILDKQIVDITGRKLVRVNDIRMVAVPAGVFVVAVDVGMEGLLRRIGINRPIQHLLLLFNARIPSRFILWDDVEAVDLTSLSIQLSKTRSKLDTLHPSDLADIIEDLGKGSKTSLFSSLDEEKAADVLEEMEVKEQVHIIESLPVAKAADVLEKMPANEAADVLDYLEDEKTEQLLHEMEPSASEEVRELMEYPDSSVGSLMTTNVLTFTEKQTIGDVINYIRAEQPEMESLYSIFVVGEDLSFRGTITLRDLLIAGNDTPLPKVMSATTPCVNDYDKLDSLSEIVSKYNLLAVPVTNDDNELEGMVVVDDIIDDLLGKRRTT